MPQTKLPRIVLTSGEPAGIGPDLIALVAQQAFEAELITIGDPDVLLNRAAALGINLKLEDVDPENPRAHQPGHLSLLPLRCQDNVTPGQLNPANGAYVVDMLTQAANHCLNGHFDAIATAPVHKGIINEAGIAFSGHTELFGEISQGHPVMMLAAQDFRVALATTHLPLKDVSAAITPEVLKQVIRILHQDLRDKYAIAKPHILVCGLNPHAGEDGHLGMEEIEVITPTLNALRDEGIILTGPLPADTLFTPKYLDDADACLAMYHDQGLPVLKYAGFGKAVNVTLGLPLIRTSVDHGTALDLAATGNINHQSFIAAINEAIRLVNIAHANKAC